MTEMESRAREYFPESAWTKNDFDYILAFVEAEVASLREENARLKGFHEECVKMREELARFKAPAQPVEARPTIPYSGPLIGKCASGQCGHDDSSWCERGPDLPAKPEGGEGL